MKIWVITSRALQFHDGWIEGSATLGEGFPDCILSFYESHQATRAFDTLSTGNSLVFSFRDLLTISSLFHNFFAVFLHDFFPFFSYIAVWFLLIYCSSSEWRKKSNKSGKTAKILFIRSIPVHNQQRNENQKQTVFTFRSRKRQRITKRHRVVTANPPEFISSESHEHKRSSDHCLNLQRQSKPEEKIAYLRPPSD